jgi:hypothetical protein
MTRYVRYTKNFGTFGVDRQLGSERHIETHIFGTCSTEISEVVVLPQNSVLLANIWLADLHVPGLRHL